MVSGRDISGMLPEPSMQLQNGQLDPDEEYPAKNRIKNHSKTSFKRKKKKEKNFASFKRSLQPYD